MPSRYETFGVVYAEAIACGKPVIATKCGGPESIINEGNGLLVEVDNSDQLAESLMQMKKNYNELSQAEIRTNFLEKFSRSVVVEQISSVYRDARTI